LIELKRGGRARRSSARTERGWHAAYVVALFLMAVTTDDKVIRVLLTATAIGAAYNLGRKSEKERSGQ
jgi:hypothetical protein